MAAGFLEAVKLYEDKDEDEIVVIPSSRVKSIEVIDLTSSPEPDDNKENYLTDQTLVLVQM